MTTAITNHFVKSIIQQYDNENTDENLITHAGWQQIEATMNTVALGRYNRSFLMMPYNPLK